MNKTADKNAIIERFYKVEDEAVILTVERIVDQALGEAQWPDGLEDAIAKGRAQSKAGEVTDHEEVMESFRSKYTR